MGTRNTADLQLWWSHPLYTPRTVSRIRGKAAEVAAGGGSPGDIFRMDAGFPDIDDLSIPSFIGQMFRTKEHMGVGQDRVRRSYVNVADVKEASGTFTCNFGVHDTPEQFFSHVQADPGSGGDGRKRPMRLYGIISVKKGLKNGTGRAAIDGAATTGDSAIGFDTVTVDAFNVGDFFRITGDTQDYQILDVVGSGAVGGEGKFNIAPNLKKDAADNAVISKRDFAPNLDTWLEANICDYIISEFDYTPEIDGELMGTFTLQAAGTGFQYVRAAAA